MIIKLLFNNLGEFIILRKSNFQKKRNLSLSTEPACKILFPSHFSTSPVEERLPRTVTWLLYALWQNRYMVSIFYPHLKQNPPQSLSKHNFKLFQFIKTQLILYLKPKDSNLSFKLTHQFTVIPYFYHLKNRDI